MKTTPHGATRAMSSLIEDFVAVACVKCEERRSTNVTTKSSEAEIGFWVTTSKESNLLVV